MPILTFLGMTKISGRLSVQIMINRKIKGLVRTEKESQER
jgi:hypothetical protein